MLCSLYDRMHIYFYKVRPRPACSLVGNTWLRSRTCSPRNLRLRPVELPSRGVHKIGHFCGGHEKGGARLHFEVLCPKSGPRLAQYQHPSAILNCIYPGLDHVCSQPAGVVSHRKRTLVWRRDMCSTIASPNPPLAPHHRTSTHVRALPIPHFAPFVMSYPYPVWKLFRGADPKRGPSEIRVLLWGGVA